MTDRATQPTQSANTLEALAQAHEGEAFALLVETVRDKDTKIEHRLKAAERILDQARGKPKVALPKDPSQRRQKAISMDLDTLMKIAQGAMARTAQADQTKRIARTLEGEFVPVVRKRPMNEHATPAAEFTSTPEQAPEQTSAGVDASNFDDLMA